MRYPYVLLLVGLFGLLQSCAAPGLGVGMSSADRRSAGTVVDDDTIEDKARQRIEDKFKTDARTKVTAFNRFALITGEVANEPMKMDIERIVGSIPNVKGIANELVVTTGGKPEARNNDSRISSNLNSRLSKNKTLKADHIRVITDAGVVYLMGLVTHAEADTASDIASTTGGVLKVVRVFEYID